MSLGHPGHIADLENDPQTLVWKEGSNAVFRDETGHDMLVQTNQPALEIGAAYRMQSKTIPFGKFNGATFWLEKI